MIKDLSTVADKYFFRAERPLEYAIHVCSLLLILILEEVAATIENIFHSHRVNFAS